MIDKKGDVEDAGNYRPICSLPVLDKLFATVMCETGSEIGQMSATRSRWFQTMEHYGIERSYISLLKKALQTARRISHDRPREYSVPDNKRHETG